MQKIQPEEERIRPATGTAYTRLISFLAPSTHARDESQNREGKQWYMDVLNYTWMVQRADVHDGQAQQPPAL